MSLVPTRRAGARSDRVPARHRRECGAVTAETAMVLPVLVLTALGLVWALSVAVAQVRVTDAAREVARLIARDETAAVALDRGREVAPPGAVFDIGTREDEVTVDVSLDVTGPGGLLADLLAVTVDASAVAAREAR